MQINITIPDAWKEKIDKIARKEAYEQDRDYSYLDVIRDAIKDYCKIIDNDLIKKYTSDSIAYIEDLKIHHPQKGLIKFDLFDYQKRYINFLESNRFVILPKFRQGGFSTTTGAWALWDAIHHPGKRTMVCCKTDREAINFGENIKFMYDNLPTSIKPTTTRNNHHHIEFENKSCIYFGTYEAACGRSVSHLIIDEAAYVENMESNWKTIYPVISTSGKCTVLSTQNEPFSWFNNILTEAREGKNGFKVFECSYLEHPEYQNPEWIKATRKALGEKGWLQEVECRCILEEPIKKKKMRQIISV